MSKRKLAWFGLLGGVAVVLAYSAVSFAAMTAWDPTANESVIVVGGGDIGGGGSCTCPQIFQPVVCGEFPNKSYFSNQCVANCAGATNCVGVVLQY